MNIDFLTQINPKKFLDTSYLFVVAPDADGLYKYLAIIFGLFILVALALIVRTKKQANIFKKLSAKMINLLLLTGFFGLLLVFFRFEGIPYLGSRLLLLIMLAVFVIWVLTIIWYKFRILPQKIAQEQKRKNFEKYLP